MTLAIAFASETAPGRASALATYVRLRWGCERRERTDSETGSGAICEVVLDVNDVKERDAFIGTTER